MLFFKWMKLFSFAFIQLLTAWLETTDLKSVPCIYTHTTDVINHIVKLIGHSHVGKLV